MSAVVDETFVVLNYMKPDTRSASDEPIMQGAPAIEPGQIVEGEPFPIAGRRHAR